MTRTVPRDIHGGNLSVFLSVLRKKYAVCSEKFISLIASLLSISKKAESLTLSSFKWASSLKLNSQNCLNVFYSLEVTFSKIKSKCNT